MSDNRDYDRTIGQDELDRRDLQIKKVLGFLAVLGMFALYYILAEFVPGPWGAPRFYDRGVDYYKDRKYDDAMHWYNRSIEVDSEYAPAYFGRAVLHRRQNDIDAALADYATVIRLRPDTANAYYNRGLIYRDLGDPAKALTDFDAYVRLKPDEADGHLRRTALYRDLGDAARGLAEYDTLVRLNGHNLPYYYGRAALRRDFGDLAGAVRDLDAAVAVAPNDAGAFVERGILRRENGDAAGGLADFTQAIALKANETDALKANDPRAYLARGEALRDAGQTDAAKAAFDDVLKHNQSSAPAYQQRGVLELFVQGDAAAAADDLNAAVRKAFEYRESADFMNFSIGVVEKQYGIPPTPTDNTPVLAPEVPLLPGIYYLIASRHLARSRAGVSDDADFKADTEKLYQDVQRALGAAAPPPRTYWGQRARWPGAVLALFAGDATPEDVRHAAEAAPGSYERRRRLCEADFYVAEYQLAKGAGTEAQKLLQSAIDRCPAAAPEATFAKAELQRLAAAAPH